MVAMLRQPYADCLIAVELRFSHQILRLSRYVVRLSSERSLYVSYPLPSQSHFVASPTAALTTLMGMGGEHQHNGGRPSQTGIKS